MYINETYDKYFNLDFPGPVPETKLHESAASDALKNLETELASLEAEIKDLKKKHGAAWSKYDKELSSTPEYQALKKEYNELWRELSHLELSYRRYDRNDPDGGEWEMDEKIYDEVKDRIAELNDKLDSMKKDYWAPSNQARAKADAEFGSAEKEQRLKQGKEEHAQNLQTLIEEETPEINQILEELNSGLAESEKFTAAFKGCYFKAGKLSPQNLRMNTNMLKLTLRSMKKVSKQVTMSLIGKLLKKTVLKAMLSLKTCSQNN